VAGLASALETTQQVAVPEPSPLFWEHFSRRVRDAVSAESAAGGGSWQPLAAWRVLVPLAGLALVVAALVVAMPRRAEVPVDLAPAVVHQIAGERVGENESGWLLVAELVGPIDWETATEAGLGIRPGAAELAVLDLTAEERRELGRLLDAELRRPKS
jgi:hypothetical protein